AALAMYDVASKAYRLLLDRLPAGDEKRGAAVAAAKLYIDSGDWAGLERLMSAYLPSDPGSPQINFLMGYALYRKGSLTEASPHFEAAVKALARSEKSPQDIDAAGRAEFLLGEIAFSDMKGFSFSSDEDPSDTLEYKKAKLDDVEKIYASV